MTVASRVGFIGLGNMGLHMARNLMKNGNRLVVCDIDPKRLAEIKAEGAEVVAHPADVASATQTIVTMLPSSPHVRDVYNSDFGILKTIRPDSLCMDSSTIDQQASIEISRLMTEKKAHYVDAPVSGGVVGAQQGTLTFMVGADSTATFDRARVFLAQMGKNVVNCGKVGNGQAAKICNNMLLGIEMIGVAETMNLGIRMGLDAKQLAAIINTSSGRCWSSDTYNPVPGVIDGIPSCRNYEGGFASALMAKDLSLAQNASTLLGVPTPLGSLAHQLYRILSHSKSYQNRDFGVVYEFLKDDRPVDGEGGSKK